jgi:P4 family phage/plasmid primase-like protien
MTDELIREKARIDVQSIHLHPGSPAEQFNQFVDAFLDAEPHYYDSKTMIWWRWNHEAKKWEQTNDVEILRTFQLEYAFTDWIEPRIRNKILEVLKVMSWNMPKPLPVSWIQFRNKVIDVVTKEEFEATKEYFFTCPVPFDISENTETPIIDGLFEDWLVEKKQLLYEICAYCLYRSYPIPKIFLFFGTGRNGKSQYIKLLNKMVGNENVTVTELALISEGMRFTTLQMMDKLLIQLTELEGAKEFPLATLKKLTGGDLIGYEVKRGGFGHFRNFGKVIMATNSMPSINEDSDAVAERFFVIDFRNHFLPTPYDIIDKIPDEEYSNLCRKCVNLLPDIINSGRFSFEGTLAEKHAAIQAKQHILSQFFDDCVEMKEGEITKLPDFMEMLSKYCNERNVVVPNEKFVRFLIRKEYKSDIVLKRNKDPEGRNIWVLDGVFLSFLNKLSTSPLFENNICKVKSDEKPEKPEKINNELPEWFLSNQYTSFLTIQEQLGLDFDNASELVRKWCDIGLIFESYPGKYRRL